MNREFLINLLFLITINVIIKPFYVFGIDLKVQNTIDDYGLYFGLLNLTYILQIFSDLGIHQYNNRNIAQHNYLFEKYFPHLLCLKGGLSVLFFALVFGSALLLGYDSNALYLLIFLGFNQVFITLIFFFRSNISGLQHYRLDSCLSILDKLLMIIICIPLLWGPWQAQFTLNWFIYAQTTAFGSTALIAFILTRRFYQSPLRLKWNSALLKAILKQSIPFSLVVLLMSLYTRIDGVMIERLLHDPITEAGIKEANIYAAAYRLLDAINMICFLFAGLLLPMFSRIIQQKKPILPLLKLSISIMLVITISFSITTCFHAENIMQFLYDDYSNQMPAVLILLMIGFNAIGIIHIVGTLLTARGNLRQMNIVFVVGIAINILTNYMLILNYGAWGAAISTVATQTFVALAEFELIRRAFNISTSIKFTSQVLLFVGGVYGLNWIIQQLPTYWLIQFIITGVIAVLWAFVVKILDAKSILQVFRSKTI